MKVYLATSGEYSDYRVEKVFKNREDAENYPLADDVEEYELCEGPADVRLRYRLIWNPKLPDESEGTDDGNPYIYTSREDYDGSRPAHRWHEYRPPHGQRLVVEAWSKKAVLKVYGEQRAQYLARKQGIS